MAKSDNTMLLLVGGLVVVGGGLALVAGGRRREPGRDKLTAGDILGGEVEGSSFDPFSGGASEQPVGSQPILNRIAEGEAALQRREARNGRSYSNGIRSASRMAQVDGLVLHQTSFNRGNDPTKYDGIQVHFIVLPNGQIVQLHDLREWLFASDNFNRYTVAVEFVGNFPSANGNWWNSATGNDFVTQEQINAGRYLVDYLIQVMPQVGSPGLKYIYAHRQSHNQRGNDPGPDLWYGVGEWAIKHRGLSDTPTGNPYKVGSGQYIPDSWRRRSDNRIA